MLLKLAKELTRKEKEERKQLPLNCSPTQLIEKNSRRSCNVGYFFLQDIYYSLGLKDICDKISHVFNTFLFNHLKISHCILDRLFFLSWTLWLPSIFTLRMIEVLPHIKSMLRLYLGNIQT